MDVTTMEATRKWAGLGIVDTIYEDEDEDTTSSILSLSPLFSPSYTPLPSRVKAWSLAHGCEADVVIHIQDSSFSLHKDPLTSRSGYFRNQLKGVSELTVSPPLKLTSETFTLVAEFCYGAHLVITPFNVASLRIAAELLNMTEVHGPLDENLLQKTEVYIRRAVTIDRDYASIVLSTCLSSLLPEAETMASLVSRCIETLCLTDGNDAVMRCFSDVKDISVQDFQLIVESMNQRLSGSHDLLYKVVDLYLKEHDGKLTDDQKCRMCNYIDCTSLSTQLLMHAVQNPRMPLRFIVQAMFVEQLNTRRSIVSAAANHQPKVPNTLGSILKRDAALRESTKIKATMNATSSRIESLESELNSLRKLLEESNNVKNTIDSGRSASFRFSSENKVERGQIGSVSSVSLRFGQGVGISESEGGFEDKKLTVEKKFGRKLMSGLKNAFRVPTFKSKNKTGKKEERNEDVVVIKKDMPYQRQSS